LIGERFGDRKMWKAQSVLRLRATDHWEGFGATDPYYGVYAADEFRGTEIDDKARERFFLSGEKHVAGVAAELDRLLGEKLPSGAVLDFGCGVGRLLIPLARHAERAVGLDVSPSMLAEARRNLALADVSAELVPASELVGMRSEFDLVHSALVLQHVPAREGRRIVASLVEALRPGGIGVLHLQIGGARRLRAYNAVMKLPLAHNVLNLVRRRPWSYPHMQMNGYDLSQIMTLLRDRGVETVHVTLAQRFGGFDTCTLYFRR
jgi:2-polyprenyl-3-methyl-5-hydroxy-6-metoxy-1,4-benzoquinol methylase